MESMTIKVGGRAYVVHEDQVTWAFSVLIDHIGQRISGNHALRPSPQLLALTCTLRPKGGAAP